MKKWENWKPTNFVWWSGVLGSLPDPSKPLCMSACLWHIDDNMLMRFCLKYHAKSWRLVRKWMTVWFYCAKQSNFLRLLMTRCPNRNIYMITKLFLLLLLFPPHSQLIMLQFSPKSAWSELFWKIYEFLNQYCHSNVYHEKSFSYF